MKSPRLLVVEDSPEDRELLCMVLKRLEYPIVETVSATECQRAFERYRNFRAVFVDLNLRDGDGLHLVKWIREHHPATPIFIVTGATHSNTVAQCYDAGALGVFVKPYTSVQNTAVLNLLDVNRAAYLAGVSKRSWRTSLCAALSIAAMAASYFVADATFKANLHNAAITIVSVGLAFGADMKTLLQLVTKKNGNGNGH